MSEHLELLLVIYSAVLVMNLIIGWILYRLYRHKLFKLLTIMWGFSFVNFALQGFYKSFDLGMYFSFSSYIIVSFCLYHFSCFVLKKENKKYILEFLCGGILIAGVIVYQTTGSYFIASWFSAAAIALPMFVSSVQLWRMKKNTGAKMLSSLLFLNAIHFLDYPILISHHQGAILGFSIALILLFAFSSFFPGFIIVEISNKYHLELKSEVKARTIELEDAVDQNQTLVNILCHDLSSPLSVLDFYFEEIKDERLSAIHNEYGESAFRSLKTLLSIVAKVKEMQAFYYDKNQVEIKKINLCQLVNESIKDFEIILSQKTIELKLVNRTNQQVEIHADWDILKNQVLANLITNAIKFSHKNSIINIVINENKKHVTLSVEDTGVGIPNDLIPRVFRWSEKTSRTGTNGEQGTGFGLPIVKACVEVIGGEIRVESIVKNDLNSNSGTKFIIQFDKI